jgi:hypothetical protein
VLEAIFEYPELILAQVSNQTAPGIFHSDRDDH